MNSTTILTLIFLVLVMVALLAFAQDLGVELAVPLVNNAVDLLTFWN